MDKGCEWEGTVATLHEHVATCTFKNTMPSRKGNTNCYVFVDDSNLWVSGQKALGKKLLDAHIDSRYRVDLGRFLQLVTKGSNISKAFLYGSIPPLIDSVWKAASKNFIVNIFRRSVRGKVKEIHGAMARDIMKTLHTKVKENVTYIIATGDRNLKPVIEEVLDNGVHVDLWSWEHAMAQEFRHLANANRLFTANQLDNVEARFSFTAYMSKRRKTEIDPTHAIVYKDALADDDFQYTLADHMHRLLRLFYMTIVQSQDPGKRDYIIEFPNSDPEEILYHLRSYMATSHFEYQPCSYPEYRTRLKQIHQPARILTTNRFAPLVDSDYESLPDTDSMSHVTTIADMASPSELEIKATEFSYNVEDWNVEIRRKLGKTTKTKCKWGQHCFNASKCSYLHTDEENQLFAKHPSVKFQYFKAKECDKKDEHVTAEQRKWCIFAHDSEDSWCLGCRMYGHLTNNCQVNK